MKLLRISSKNFRTLENVTLNFSEKYCTISGKNNAGKSAIIKLLLNLLEIEPKMRWHSSENYRIDYKEDKTQWNQNDDPIEISYCFRLYSEDDLSLIKFVEKFSGQTLSCSYIDLNVDMKLSSSDHLTSHVTINTQRMDEQASKEIIKKIRSSNLLFLHNSTNHEEVYYGRGRARAFYEACLSDKEQKNLDDAAQGLQNKIKKLAKEHKNKLNNLLGKLSEKYDVEFAPLESYFTRRVPLVINLKDKNVEVPLNDWGSGTQNRTYILMSILQANRIKTQDLPEDKITPIVVIEEPESFLHPSAQSEFGKILRELSTELDIQIISTTHSPYMLNQENPSANILLFRNTSRGKLLESKIIDTSGDNWMSPFADHLGINPKEFNEWSSLFSTNKTKVLLVEGDIDKQYFEYFRKKRIGKTLLNDEVEIIEYGGKDALKNTTLVKFVLSKFDQVFITFDLDALSDIKKSLEILKLQEKFDYLAIGLDKTGKKSIEGLLPEKVLSKVMTDNTDLMLKLSAANGSEKKSAKSEFKQKCLNEFKKHQDYTEAELSEFMKVIKIINKKFK